MGLDSKIHLVVNEYAMTINFIVTNGSHIDYEKVIHLINNIDEKSLSAYLSYDTKKFYFILLVLKNRL